MSEQRQRVEAEARELYPDGQADEAVRINELRAAFIAGRTVNAEQVEAAAKDMSYIFTDTSRWLLEDITRHAFRAAGLLIEGEDDE